jgi:hypothetical protein
MFPAMSSNERRRLYRNGNVALPVDSATCRVGVEPPVLLASTAVCQWTDHA